MRSIGQIALIMLENSSDKDIEESMCGALRVLLDDELITQEEDAKFRDVITGWQATEFDHLETMRIIPTSTHESIDTIKGREIKAGWHVYIDVTFEQKRQWLVNLASYRMAGF